MNIAGVYIRNESKLRYIYCQVQRLCIIFLLFVFILINLIVCQVVFNSVKMTNLDLMFKANKLG